MKPNRLLRINLTDGQVSSERIPDPWLEKFMGGKGLGAALLHQENEPKVNPLSPANSLIFVWGPFLGIAPGASRYCAITKSPLTGTFLDSYSGGHFPAYLRFNLPDYLGILFEGKASNPVALQIENNKAKLVEVKDYWGLDTREIAKQLEGYSVAAIGPAGENLVKFATISSEGGKHHAGRGGSGAVMGSKNLKAVFVKKHRKPGDLPELNELRKKQLRYLANSDNTRWAREAGTIGTLAPVNEVGALPTRNWTKGSFEKGDSIDANRLHNYTHNRVSCYLCPIACGYNLKFNEGKNNQWETNKGPEYETVVVNGSLTEIGDIEEIAKIGALCDRLGLDTISTGNAISWAMECSKRGLIDYKIEFGDAEQAMELIKRIAYREDLGDLLANGTKYAGEEVGGEAREASLEVKGLELPSFDPRGSFSMALAYATSDRGACHQRAFPIATDALGDERDPYSTEGHAKAVIEDQNWRSLTYSLITCDFTAYNLDQIYQWLVNLGYDVTRGDLGVTGERVWNLTRLFNLREGFSRKGDSLPARLKRPLEGKGPTSGNRIAEGDFNEMLDRYYQLRDWDEEGRPTSEKLKELDLAKWA